jgi:hypothetical protein
VLPAPRSARSCSSRFRRGPALPRSPLRARARRWAALLRRRLRVSRTHEGTSACGQSSHFSLRARVRPPPRPPPRPSQSPGTPKGVSGMGSEAPSHPHLTSQCGVASPRRSLQARRRRRSSEYSHIRSRNRPASIQKRYEHGRRPREPSETARARTAAIARAGESGAGVLDAREVHDW